MPQFDFTTYSAQIFWFLLCFAALYSTMHFVVLPRISSIISQRKKVIDSDNSSTQEFEIKTSELQEKTAKLRNEASAKYQARVEGASKDAAKTREKVIEELKTQFDEATHKSREEIRNFIEKSKEKNDQVVADLIKTIKAKILG